VQYSATKYDISFSKTCQKEKSFKDYSSLTTTVTRTVRVHVPVLSLLQSVAFPTGTGIEKLFFATVSEIWSNLMRAS
jgi:hypothetical protein